MDSSTHCTDRYLMTLSYKTMLDSDDKSAGRGVSFGEGQRARVNVRVTNRLRPPLTPDNLLSLSLSIPGLHTRLNNRTPAANIGLFHYGSVLIHPDTPSWYNLPPVPVDHPDGSPAASLAPPIGGFYERDGGGTSRSEGAPVSVRCEGALSGQPGDSTSEQGSPGSLSSGSEDFYSCPSSQDSFPSTWSSHWGSATGSPTTQSQHEELVSIEGQQEERVSIEFNNQRYLRVLSRAEGTTDAGVEATWTVTDFTDEEGGVQVFSLRLDFLRPRPAMPRWMRGIEVDEECC